MTLKKIQQFLHPCTYFGLRQFLQYTLILTTLMTAVGVSQQLLAQEIRTYDPQLAEQQELMLRFILKIDEALAVAKLAATHSSDNSPIWFDYQRFFRDLRLIREGVLRFVYADLVVNPHVSDSMSNKQQGKLFNQAGESAPWESLSGAYRKTDKLVE